MAEIRKLIDKNNVQFFPVTHINAVVGSDNTSLSEELASKQDAIEAVQVNIDGTSGTPSGSASMSGNTLQFSFSGIKGNDGATGAQGPQGPAGVTSAVVNVDNTSGTPSATATVQNGVLTINISGIKGETGNSGYSGAADELEVVNNLNSDDATAALSAYQGKVLDGKVTQLGQKTDMIEGAVLDGVIEETTTTDNYTPTSYVAQAVEDPAQILPVGAQLTKVTMYSTGTSSGASSELRIYDSSRALVRTIVLGIIGTSNTTFDISGEGVIIQEGYHYGVYRVGYKWVSGLSRFVYANNGNAISSSFFGFVFTYQVVKTAFEEPINDLNDSVDDLQSQINKITDIDLTGLSVQKIDITPTEGYFITNSGSVAASSGFAYSQRFQCSKGDTIVFFGRGYAQSVGMISKYVDANSRYSVKCISLDSTVRKYVFVCTDDGEYVVSYNVNEQHDLYVISNSIQSIADNLAELNDADLITKTASIEETQQAVTIRQSGKFISSSGSVQTASGYNISEKFFVKKGDSIVFLAAGYSTTLAMIAKVITEDVSYKPLTISIDAATRRYVCNVKESGYYAVSWNQKFSPQITILSYDFMPDDIGGAIGPMYCGVPSVGIIGDSLACGAGYNPIEGAAYEYPQYAWWRYLERESGMTYRRFARGGQNTRTFLTDDTYGLPACLTAGNECALYIIALEVNDRSGIGSSYLGAASDIDLTNPDNNADTYYGNYARIIQKITAFNSRAKFMLFTNPRTDGDFNNAIRTIAEMFSNCVLVDLWEKYNKFYTGSGVFNRFQDQSGHYPAVAYQGMAKLIKYAMDEAISENSSIFYDVQY